MAMTGEKVAEKKAVEVEESLEGSIIIRIDAKGNISGMSSIPEKKYSINQMINATNLARAYLFNIKL